MTNPFWDIGDLLKGHLFKFSKIDYFYNLEKCYNIHYKCLPASNLATPVIVYAKSNKMLYFTIIHTQFEIFEMAN